MDTMYFTEWGTVVLGKKEIKIKKFFNMLDRHIDDENYNVSITEPGDYKVNYGINKTYMVALSEKQQEEGLNNADIKHLSMLATIEKENKKNIINYDALDIETKKFYLEKLKNKKFSINDYLSNWIKDLIYSEKCVADEAEELEATALLGIFLGNPIGAIIGIFEAIISKNISWLLMSFCGVVVCAPLIIATTIVHIVNRFRRFFNKINDKIVDNIKIKTLENEISIQENKQKEETKEMKIKCSVPLIINDLITKLKEVNIENRENLTEEIKELLIEYRDKVKETSKSDSEIIMQYPEIIKKVALIEMKIDLAKKKNANIPKLTETQYLLGKLSEIETPITEVAENQKVKELCL